MSATESTTTMINADFNVKNGPHGPRRRRSPRKYCPFRVSLSCFPVSSSEPQHMPQPPFPSPLPISLQEELRTRVGRAGAQPRRRDGGTEDGAIDGATETAPRTPSLTRPAPCALIRNPPCAPCNAQVLVCPGAVGTLQARSTSVEAACVHLARQAKQGR